MTENEKLDRIAISVHSHRLLRILLRENPMLETIMRESKNEIEAQLGVKNWIHSEYSSRKDAFRFQIDKVTRIENFEKLSWNDYAIIRILDYIDHAGIEYPDRNLRGEIAVSNPIRLIWLAVIKGTGGAKPDFFIDMIQLFRQLRGESNQLIPDRDIIEKWMDRYPSGLDPRIVELRRENKERIINLLIDKIDSGEIPDKLYAFPDGLSYSEKQEFVREWWNHYKFHLRFAFRSPDLLNEMLGHSLDPDTMKILYDAEKVGIPFFVNPYYLSLLHVRVPYFAIGADLAIRHYIVYSRQLVEEFGNIVAWEKEDEVIPGKPNAAGWILPSYNNIHRRYPEVAILIPDSMGRACGGLCSSCQRMFDFQRGNLNFDLEKLKPNVKWPEKLKELLKYFEDDTQLRDILITGGDALMSSDQTLKNMLDGIYDMARNKQIQNKKRADGDKFAEMQRIRLGTRILAYLPQRVTPELVKILGDFRQKAQQIGISQFIIQTHFQSPM